MNNRLVLLSTALLALTGFATALAQTPLSKATLSEAPLSEIRWNSPETDDVAFLTSAPGECLAPAKKAGANYQIELGRAAFSSPFLFGGTAARTGLSCNSCHRDGRDNPDFFLQGLSGEPGTADVTSSVFSKTREDNIFNPVPIPTLVDIARQTSFGSTAPQPSIHAFVAGAVADEFQGVAAPGIVDGIAAYVAHLDSGFCPDGAAEQTLERAVGNIARTLRVAEEAMRRGEVEVADFLILSARHGLGLIHERYRGDRLAAERGLVADLSRQLADLRPRDKGDLAALAGKIAPALDQLDLVKRRLRRKERQSLYNEKQLRRLLMAEGPVVSTTE